MISVTIEGLIKRFGSMTALNGIDLRIEPGELFFLLGPSGCGKTTLLRSIAGFYIPEAGRIHFGDDDVTELPPHRRNTGMMFQSYALWPHMTVAGNVAFGLEERKVPKAETKARVAEALASVKMDHLAERKINQLSGGQQQRVALARALVIRPRCLLLDEPLSNLDAKLRLEMRTEIRRACKESGLTAIYVTHDQKEALSVADRLAILDGGKLAQIGPPREVYRRPRSRLVADFIGETNFIPGEVVSIDDRECHVKTAHGAFAGYLTDPTWHPTVGEAVVVSVRPECWTLERYSDYSPTVNVIRGKVGRGIYLGEIAQYEFQSSVAPNLEPITLMESNPQFGEHTGRGDDWIACAQAKDVVVLRA
ncbi:MAG: ABC transporter ATP-binding protein [Verrucomicrobia bacterium]|nr:ABC transporter ATP-binding protein [Verrucomicrobiota bacterium]